MFDLPDGEVHLWFAFPEDWKDPAACASAGTVLDAGELARMERLRSREGRRLFGISHWLVRTALAHYEGRHPGSWRFIVSEQGKPRIDPVSGRSALSFSLAHTKGLAVVAVTKGNDVGVDVERTDRRVDAQRLIRRFFAPEEVRALENLPPETLNNRFFLHWTLKEAGLKALAVGLSRPLNDFAFRLPKERLRRIAFCGAPPAGGKQWRWAAIAPQSSSIAAVGVVTAPGKAVTLRCVRAAPSGLAKPFACMPIALSEDIICGQPALAHGVLPGNQ